MGDWVRLALQRPSVPASQCFSDCYENNPGRRGDSRIAIVAVAGLIGAFRPNETGHSYLPLLFEKIQTGYSWEVFSKQSS